MRRIGVQVKGRRGYEVYSAELSRWRGVGVRVKERRSQEVKRRGRYRRQEAVRKDVESRRYREKTSLLGLSTRVNSVLLSGISHFSQRLLGVMWLTCF